MARPSKPFFRKQTKSWYCSINGRQISLGKDREAAHKKFHTLLADQSLLSAEITTIYELSQTYLDWCEKNRKRALLPITFEQNLGSHPEPNDSFWLFETNFWAFRKWLKMARKSMKDFAQLTRVALRPISLLVAPFRYSVPRLQAWCRTPYWFRRYCN